MVFDSISLADVIELVSIGIGMGSILAEVKTLSKRVEKHNNVVERVYKLETNVGNTDIGALSQKVDDAREQIKEIKECKNTCLNNHQIS